MEDDILRSASVTRYITPLREGGSLPALAEADDGFKYVVKFRGAGHGTKALIAELIGGEVARAAGLRVPELVFLDIDKTLGAAKVTRKYKICLKPVVALMWDCIISPGRIHGMSLPTKQHPTRLQK